MSANELTQKASLLSSKSAGKEQGLLKRLRNKYVGEDSTFFIRGSFDMAFFITVIVLLTIGLIMMFSASYVEAKYDYGSPYGYIIRQLAWAALGLAAMFFVSRINPVVFRNFTRLIVIISIFALILVLFWHKVDPDQPDIKRWYPEPFSFQPSDMAKLGMIMGLAYIIEKYKKLLEKTPLMFFALCAFVVVFCGLIALEHHLSGTLITFAVGGAMIFLSGVNRKWIIAVVAVAAVAATILLLFRGEILDDYQNARIDSFLAKDYYDTDKRYQTNQSLFALGSGGLFGLGIGKSKQKFRYIPEPQNDFIFSIVGEELGFFRCVIIIAIFALLVYLGFRIAEKKAQSMYERLLVLGIMVHIAIQTILNLLVVTDFIPNTGITLPFFSYGGTALIVILIEMGIVLSVSRSGARRIPKENKENTETGESKGE